MSSQPKLYQYAVCPFCWKAKAVLAYKEIPYEAVEVHPLNKKELAFSKDYRKVPIFVDTQGRQINDSTAIMKHIDAQYAERPVFEKGAAQEEENKWLKWADEVLVRALPPLIYQNIPDAIKAFDYITQEGKFSWFQQRAVKYSGAIVMNLVAKKTAKRQGISDPVTHVQKCLEDWAQALGPRSFLGNEKPNGADLAVYGILRSIAGLPGFKYIRENRRGHDWYQRVAALCKIAA